MVQSQNEISGKMEGHNLLCRTVSGFRFWTCAFFGSSRQASASRDSENKGRILRPGLSSSHLTVVLCKNGIRTTVCVHRLVAEVWLGSCPAGMEVCHGPNGQLDNSVSNLRWDTRTNNNLDKRRDGTHGGRCVKRSDGVEFINMQVAAEETSCNSTHISKVCKGERKTTGGYGWEYIK